MMAATTRARPDSGSGFSVNGLSAAETMAVSQADQVTRVWGSTRTVAEPRARGGGHHALRIALWGG
jgi:hypothetical protein